MKREEACKLSETALDELRASLAAGQSEAMIAYLACMAKFHNYSFGNIMLILSQCPEATQVAGYKTWPKLGRHVRKGEKGICILAPMTFKQDSTKAESRQDQDTPRICFRAVHVFDVSQTDGDPLPEPAAIQGDPANKLAALEQLIVADGIRLVEEELVGAIGVSRKGEIALSPGLAPAERFAVLAHELAHERLHDKEARRNLSKAAKETEAEAVAFVVCTAFGLDTKTRSSDYIQLSDGNAEQLTKSLTRIQQTASEMIKQITSEANHVPAETSVGNTVSRESQEVTVEARSTSSGLVSKLRSCDHALYHVDNSGHLQGSWQATVTGDLVRIACRYCDKFYGYRPIPETTPLASEPVR